MSEFKNVVGRAGRAYVDVEGLVLYPIFDQHARRVRQWEELIADVSSREMESGLVRLLVTLLLRMNKRVGGTLEQLIEYVMNNAEAWAFPEIPGESVENRERARVDWESHVATLDTAVLSLLGENEIADDAIATSLDDILQSSLWERRLNRRSEEIRAVLKAGLLARSRYIWTQSTAVSRRGYFLAGIGLKTGLTLDEFASDGNALLVAANGAVLDGDEQAAIDAITAIAERVFFIHPFAPNRMPVNWQNILSCWLLGLPLADVSARQEAETLQFVEGGLVYRLPWAMEAIRVRGIANRDLVGDMGLQLDDFELAVAVSSVETGTLNRSASILIQAGFSSRLAAIKAVNDTAATFTNAFELQQWLASDRVAELSALADWPTVETKELWSSFNQVFTHRPASTWKEQRYWAPVAWHPGAGQASGTPVRCHHLEGQPTVLSAEGLPIGTIHAPLNPNRLGLLRVSVMDEPEKILLSYLGPEDLWLA